MPLIARAYVAFAAGLLAGFGGEFFSGVAAALATTTLAWWRRSVTLGALSLVGVAGMLVARGSPPPPTRAPVAFAALAPLRDRAGVTIDAVFGTDAPLARALLIADMHGIPAEIRDRYATAGIIHMLSISGLHVAIIAMAMGVLFQFTRLPPRWASIGTMATTTAYVAVIGAPAPAVRSAAMLAGSALSRLVQRPTSPWATLAAGALVPLALDPTAVLDLGYQLSVGGIAGLIASGAFARRVLVPRLEGWRLTVARDLLTSLVATVVTGPLVAWTFGRISVVSPLTNLLAGPVLGVAQPMLFLALVCGPVPTVARFLADAAHPLLALFDGIATAGAAVPHAAIPVAPTFATACACAAASAATVVACVSRYPARPLLVAVTSVVVAIWAPTRPAGSGFVELHMIDVGQGDALALRTPHGTWILFDAGRVWRAGDAGRSLIIPYLRRREGALAAFILSHPHADHVGGARSVLSVLRPLDYYDAAFTAGSQSYAASLAEAKMRHVRWHRVHPGDSIAVDSVLIRFLAPDSAWTVALADPNSASTVALVHYGAVRFLLVGDAEAAEEAWLLSHVRDSLHADVLKVGHHGSATSTTPAFLAAVRPRVALVSVGAGNVYGHPSVEVMRALASAGAQVLRTDLRGNVVVRTDGHSITLEAKGRTWPVLARSVP